MGRERKTGPHTQQRASLRATMSRRRLLQGSAATAALGGVSALVAGCNKRREPEPRASEQDVAGAATMDLRQSLVALVLALGPWRSDQADLAEQFLGLFATEERLRGYEDAAPQIMAAAARIPAGARALGEIQLDSFPEPERQALLRVLHDVYRLKQVRYFVAGQPLPGTCMGDLKAFLTAPQDG